MDIQPPTIFCQVCNLSIQPPDTIMQTGRITHHDGPCVPGNCHICEKPVLDSPHILFIYYEGGRKTSRVVHQLCNNEIACSNCHTKGGTLVMTGNGAGATFKHGGFCLPDLCLVCSRNIGPEKHVLVGVPGNDVLPDAASAHLGCMALVACYICESRHQDYHDHLRPWMKDAVGFRHQNCRPDPCAECQRPLGSMIRTVFGKEYHANHTRVCGPVCKICGKIDATDHTTLNMLEHEFKHWYCSSEPCIVCQDALGYRWTTSDEITSPHGDIEGKIHTACLFECAQCNFNSMTTEKIPFDPILHPKNIPYINPMVTLSAAACRRALKLNRVSKDMRRLILSYIANSQVRDRTLPFRNNGQIDARKHCNHHRCASKLCEWCESPLSWLGSSWTRYYMCSDRGCARIKTKIRDLIGEVFGAKFVPDGWGDDIYNSAWPVSHETGLREIERLLVNGILNASLTVEQINLCQSQILKIRMLLQGQLPDLETLNSNNLLSL